MTLPSKLGRRAGRGAAWVTASTLASKAVGVLSQLVLAALLAQEDFGVIALCYTAVAFAAPLGQFGVREVLIRSQGRYSLLLGPAILLEVGASVLAAAIVLGVAPLLANLWSTPAIIGPMLVLAIEMPIAAATRVTSARLEIDMRFRAIAKLDIWSMAGTAVLSVALAAAGAGAYAFVVPRVIVTLLRFAAIWRMTQPAPRFRRVRALLPRFYVAAGPMFFGALLLAVGRNADYAILGVVLTTAQVGVYYFAFAQSTQVATLLNTGLTRVMLPALSTLRDDEPRQVRVLLQTTRLLALPAAGMCVLQATLAGPFLRLLFGERWLDAIPVLQLLSLAAAPAIACWPWQGLLLAQGRYWLKLRIHAFGATMLVTAVAIGIVLAKLWQLETLITVTAAVMVSRLISAPLSLWVACRGDATILWEILKCTYRPTIGALLTIGVPGFALAPVLSDWAMLALAPLLLLLYALWLLVLERESLVLFLDRLGQAMPHPAVLRVSDYVRQRQHGKA